MTTLERLRTLIGLHKHCYHELDAVTMHMNCGKCLTGWTITECCRCWGGSHKFYPRMFTPAPVGHGRFHPDVKRIYHVSPEPPAPRLVNRK